MISFRFHILLVCILATETYEEVAKEAEDTKSELLVLLFPLTPPDWLPLINILFQVI